MSRVKSSGLNSSIFEYVYALFCTDKENTGIIDKENTVQFAIGTLKGLGGLVNEWIINAR